MPVIRWKPFLEPWIDVYEKENKIIAETPIAGIDPDKVTISIENDILTIKGQTGKKSEVEDKNYYRQEIRYGSFYRSVSLPSHVIADKAEASYQDGVLRISMPKAAGTEKKKKLVPIKVKKGSAKKVKTKKK